MLFINLPQELLQLILLHSSTPSFVQWIRTCHTLFDLAAQSRQVITHHLNNVLTEKLVLPGGIIPTQELFLMFRRRAAASLQGVSITADRRDYCFPTSSVDVRASCLTSIKGPKIALAWRGASDVQVYEVSQSQLKHRAALNLGSDYKSTYKPLQTAFDELNNVYVLYSIAENNGQFSDQQYPHSGGSFEDVATRTRLTRVGLSALACSQDSWDLSETIGGDLCEDADADGKEARRINMVAISMAAHGGNSVSVAWDASSCLIHPRYTRVALYTVLEGDGEAHALPANDIEAQCRNFRHLRFTDPYDTRYSPSSITFPTGLRAAVDCYAAGLATPMCRIDFKPAGTTEVTVRTMGVRIDDDLIGRFFVRDPFFAYHEIGKLQKHTGSRSCRDARLCFATGTLSEHSQTIGCVLRSTMTIVEDGCLHNTTSDLPHRPGFNTGSQIVARLWGFKLPATTMAPPMAFAEQGTRIAVASWDKIFIWPLQPRELVHTSLCEQVDNKVHDQKLKCSWVEIKPIVLKADAVVHKMTFTANQNELVTITDRGLQIWNLGPSAIGRRTVDASYDNEN